MTHRERAVAALERRQPDFVPHFELAFLETDRDFDGRTFYGAAGCPGFNGVAYREAIAHNARLYIDIARKFDHSIICLNGSKPQNYPDFTQGIIDLVRSIREQVGDEFLILCHGDATYSVPGNDMMEFTTRLMEDPQGVKREAELRVAEKLVQCKRMLQAGVDGFTLCSDYAFNSGPFLSPGMFADFVAPYLKLLVHEQRALGAYVIKHTDGNIMPVLDMILEAEPHALHSIDPMAGMDIRLIKKEYGSRVALCGNVHCAYMQTGTPDQISESADYCLRWAKPGGGYLFSTSNSIFRGMPLESYDLIHRIWRQKREYEKPRLAEGNNRGEIPCHC